jgi:uncharacterized protein (TIGR00251 family)
MTSTAPFIRETPSGIVLSLAVVPRAKTSKIMGFHDGLPKIALAAPASEGRANEELVRFLKQLLRIPSKNIQLIRGDTSRRKSILIEGLSLEEVKRAFTRPPPE